GDPAQRPHASRVPVAGHAGRARAPRGRCGREPAVRRLLAPCFALLVGTAAGHPMLVIGEVKFDPDPPTPGAAATVTVTLQETSLAEVEDAVVFLELRAGAPPEAASAPPGDPLVATDRLEEVA